MSAPGVSGDLLARGVSRMRAGEVFITPGYDGEYGVIRLFEDELNKRLAKDAKQKHLKVRLLFVPMARDQLLPALCHALGEWTGATVPDLPWAARSEDRSLAARLRPVTRLLRRRTTGVPAPIVVTAS